LSRSLLDSTVKKGMLKRKCTVAASIIAETNPEGDLHRLGSARNTRQESPLPSSSMMTSLLCRKAKSSIWPGVSTRT